MNEATENPIYYIEAVGTAATRIGRRSISPNMPPEEFTEKEYNNNLRYIEYYEKQGVISVAKPGTRKAILQADAIIRERERLEEIYAGEDDDEPDPVLRERGFSVREEDAEKRTSSRKKIPKWTAPAAPVTEGRSSEDYQCIAISVAAQRRCMNKAGEDILVCRIHKATLDRGKEVRDSNGRLITADGKGLKKEE